MTRKTVICLFLAAAAAAALYARACSRAPAEPAVFFRSLPAACPLVIAHRGGAGLFPENTLAAFLGSVELGADILELDLRRTADGVPVVIHDETVDRTTNGSGRVDSFTLTELKQFDAGYRFCSPVAGDRHPYRGRGLTVPALREVFSALSGRRLILEVKENDPALTDAVIALVREFDRAEITLAGSFHDDIIHRFRASSPEITTPASEKEVTRFLPAAWLGLEGLIRPDYGAFLVPPRSGLIPVTTRRFLRAARNRGIFTAAWTVNDPAEMRSLLDRGIGGLITDRPDLALNWSAGSPPLRPAVVAQVNQHPGGEEGDRPSQGEVERRPEEISPRRQFRLVSANPIPAPSSLIAQFGFDLICALTTPGSIHCALAGIISG